MLEIAPAESEAHYREVRELLVELIRQSSRLRCFSPHDF